MPPLTYEGEARADERSVEPDETGLARSAVVYSLTPIWPWRVKATFES